MPAPYPLVVVPEGDFRNVFDQQAIQMVMIHNTFIRGINAIVAQAPNITEKQVEGFVFFCSAFVDTVHHHHTTEEEIYFPEIEKRLGVNSMDVNIEQHKMFLPQMGLFEEHLKDVTEGKKKYDGAVMIEKLNSFTDPLMVHMHDEIKTLESSRLRAVFTEAELHAIDQKVLKRGIAESNFYISLPLFMSCHNSADAPWFNPLPTLLVWAVRLYFYRRHRDAWEFAPCDLYGRMRTLKAASTEATKGQ
ncbi:hypothetical protein C8J56DRAFT_64783 [Mycena floridula]|nr:hypothetical protein C8J56DRAFT_64783 [Mycena floridula]